MSEELQVWKPSQFQGSDLLPIALAGGAVDKTGREHVGAGDLILPSLSVLQGMSDVVTQNTIPGARPGLFYHSGAGELFEGPIRVLICAHTKSRSLFPHEDRAEHQGLEKCLSRDAVTGDKYGDCGSCPYKEWGENNSPPPCSESNNFTVLTSMGPAVIRFARTSFKASRNFITTWTMSPKPLWAHPAIITCRMEQKELKGGKKSTFFPMEIRWAQREDVPPAAQAAARGIHEQVMHAFEQGRFDATGPSEE